MTIEDCVKAAFVITPKQRYQFAADYWVALQEFERYKRLGQDKLVITWLINYLASNFATNHYERAKYVS